MRRVSLVCLSFLFILLLSLSTTSAQEIVYSTPAWVKGYGAIWFTEHTPDNSQIILATSTGLYLLNTHTPDVLPVRLEGHTDTIRSVAFSLDGSLMATSSFDGTVRLWRMPSGEAIWSARLSDPCCESDPPAKVFFTDDASLLMVEMGAQYSAGAFVINVHSGKALHIENNMFPNNATIRGNDLFYINQAKDGFHIYRLHATDDKIAQNEAAALNAAQVQDEASPNTAARLTKDYAIALSDKSVLSGINLKNGNKLEPIIDFPQPMAIFENTVWGTRNGILSAVNLDTGTRVDLALKDIRSNDNKQWLLYIDTDGQFSVFDLTTLEHTAVIPMATIYSWTNGYLLYSENTSIKLFNAATGKTITLEDAVIQNDNQLLYMHIADDKLLTAYGTNPIYFGIFDALTGKKIVAPTPYISINLNLSVTDKDRFAISAQDTSGQTSGLLVADLKSGMLGFYPTPISEQPQLFIGDQLFYRNREVGYGLLDFTTGEQIRFTSEGHSVSALAFSPDSKRLATGGTDNTVRLWDVNTGAQVALIAVPNMATRIAYGERGIAALYTHQLQFINIPATSVPTNTLVGSTELDDIALQGDTIAAAGEGNVQLFTVDTAGNISATNRLVPVSSKPSLRQYNTVAMSERYIAAAGSIYAKDGSLLDTVVDLWNVTTHKYVQRLDSQTHGQAYDLSFSSDGAHLALTTGGITVVWNFQRTLTEPAFITTTGLDSGSAFAGNVLASVEQSWLKHTVDLHAANDGIYMGTLRRTINSSGSGGGNSYRVPLAASADGSYVALVDASGELVMWHIPAPFDTTNSDKAYVIPYCDSLGLIPVNPTQNQPVMLTWSWYATNIPNLMDHLRSAYYEIALDGTNLPQWQFQRSTANRNKVNNNNWTLYYSLDVGTLKPGVHTLMYRLTWQSSISDGITDYGPNTAHPEDTGTCTFTVN